MGVAGQHQIFDRRGQCGGEHALDGVGAAICRFDHNIAQRVDDEQIIAGAASHHIIAGPAVQGIGTCAPCQSVMTAEPGQPVRAAVADQDIGGRVAGSRQARGSRQGQVLKVLSQNMADNRDHRIDALTCQFDKDIARRAEHERIVADAA